MYFKCILDCILNGGAVIINSIDGLIGEINYKDESIFSWAEGAFRWESKRWIGSI